MIQGHESYRGNEAERLVAGMRSGRNDFKFDRIANEFNSPEQTSLKTLGEFCEAYVSRANRLLANPQEVLVDYQKFNLEKHLKQYAHTKEVIEDLKLEGTTSDPEDIKKINDPETLVDLLYTCTEIFKFRPYELNIADFHEMNDMEYTMEGLYKLMGSLELRLYEIYNESTSTLQQQAELFWFTDILNDQKERIGWIKEAIMVGRNKFDLANTTNENLILDSKLADVIEKQANKNELTIYDAGRFAKAYSDSALAFYERVAKKDARTFFANSDGAICREIYELSKDRNEIGDFDDKELVKLLSFSTTYTKMAEGFTSKRDRLGPYITDLNDLRPFYMFFKKVYDEAKSRDINVESFIEATYQQYSDKFGSHKE